MFYRELNASSFHLNNSCSTQHQYQFSTDCIIYSKIRRKCKTVLIKHLLCSCSQQKLVQSQLKIKQIQNENKTLLYGFHFRKSKMSLLFVINIVAVIISSKQQQQQQCVCFADIQSPNWPETHRNLWFPSNGIKCVHHHTWLFLKFLSGKLHSNVKSPS